MSLRKRELAIEKSAREVAEARETTNTEMQRAQDVKELLIEKERLVAAREEMLVSREDELSHRKRAMEDSERRVALLTRRLTADLKLDSAMDTMARAAAAGPCDSDGVASMEKSSVGKHVDDSVSREENGGSSLGAVEDSSVHSNGVTRAAPCTGWADGDGANLETTLSKASSRIERLDKIVQGIRQQGGNANTGAVITAQQRLEQLKVDLKRIIDGEREGSDGEEDARKGALLEWEGRLGRALEEVVAMQRVALASRAPRSHCF